MKVTDLDEGRLQYIWSDFAEQTYQVLQRADEFEWKKYHSSYPEGKDKVDVFRCGGNLYYLAYVDGEPIEYADTLDIGGDPVSRRIVVNIITKLKIKDKIHKLPYLNKEQYQAFRHCTSWEEFDGAFCSAECN